MKSLIPFPDTEAFPAKNGSGYRSMAVIFAGFHTLPIYPLKNIIMETKFIEQLVMAVPESLRETTLALQTEVEELLKAKSTKNSLYWNPIPGTRNCAAISCGVWKNCPNCLPCHAKSTGHC